MSDQIVAAEVLKIKVKLQQAVSMVEKLLSINKVPMIHGSPGCGKSAIAHLVAAKHNLKVIDVRLSQREPSDLLGLPNFFMDENDRQRARHVPMETFPLEGDELPPILDAHGHEQLIIDDDGKRRVLRYNGWLLFLDEINSAARETQAAAYQITLDRMVGQEKLHKRVKIMCAGNLETDGAIVEPMSTALQSRLCHMELETDVKEWCEHAGARKFDYRLTSFIQFKPSALYDFKADHTDRTFSSPRTLEFVSDYMLKYPNLDDEDALPIVAGMIGTGQASELLNFCRIFGKIPTISDICIAPEQIAIPRDASIVFATIGMIAHFIIPGNAPQLIMYVRRLPIDMQVVCARMMLARDQTLLGETAMRDWVAAVSKYLY